MSLDRLTIVSHDCWSYFMHKDMKIPHNTPFYDIWIDHDVFLSICKHFYEIDFDNIKYLGMERQEPDGYIYPVVMLDDKYKLHPIHCLSYYEFKTKWLRRAKRINFHNLLFKFCDYTKNSKLQNKFLKVTEGKGKRVLYTRNAVEADKLYCIVPEVKENDWLDDGFDLRDENLVDFISND